MRRLMILALWLCPFFFNAQIISTIAGTGTVAFNGDGISATAANFSPRGIAIAKNGTIYLGDYNNTRIRKIDTLGIITTICGTGSSGYTGDGGPATSAKLASVADVILDKKGNIYFSDFGYSVIRKIDTSGVITTIAGTGTSGYSGDGGAATAAKLSSPEGMTFDKYGNLYVADMNNHRVRRIDTLGIITTVAGMGVSGFAGDGGVATAAKLYLPNSVTIDTAMNIYICDYGNIRVRKIDPSGIITTFAGTGVQGLAGDGGPATSAKFFSPEDVEMDAVGNVYVADWNNHRIRKITVATGIITTFAGYNWGFGGDGGAASLANLLNPQCVCFDKNGNMLIADYGNARIRKVTYCASPLALSIAGPATVCGGTPTLLVASGATSYTWSATAGNSLNDSVTVTPTDAATTYSLCGATGGCINTASLSIGNTVTISASPANPSICQQASATLTASGGASYTWSPGGQTGATVLVNPLTSTVYTVTGVVGGCLASAHSIVNVQPTPTISPINNYTACAGTSVPPINFTVSPSGSWTNWSNNGVGGLASSGSGNISSFTAQNTTALTKVGVVTVTAGYNVCQTTRTFSITVYASPVGGAINGTSSICAGDTGQLSFNKQALNYLWQPGGITTPTIAISPQTKTIYTLSASDSACAVSTFTYQVVSGQCKNIITAFAGNGATGYTGNGGQASSATMNAPQSTAVDLLGNVYVADANNNVVRKISSTGIITAVAGTGTSGFSGDGGAATAAKLNFPIAIALDASGNIYISDYYNSRIRKINTSGIISTIAGTGTQGHTGDGGLATAAQIRYPRGLTVSPSGDLVFAEEFGHTIRKINSSGIISTIAGTGVGGFSGDGGAATAAQLYYPQNPSYDSNGNLYIADYTNNRIRKIDGSGIITTIAGTGTSASTGDGGQATLASLKQVGWVSVDKNNNIYVVEQGANIVRKIDNSGVIDVFAGTRAIGNTGDMGPAVLATFNQPSGVSCDTSGNVYVTDMSNNRIRKVGYCQTPVVISSVSPGPYCSGDTICFHASGGTATYTWPLNGSTSSTLKLVPPYNTTYTLSCVSGGCVTTKMETISVTPFSMAISGPQSLCSGDSVVLYATGTPATFTWMPGGLVSNSYSIHPTASATYSVTGSAGPCTRTITKFVQVDQCAPLGQCNNTGFEFGTYTGWTLGTSEIDLLSPNLPCDTCGNSPGGAAVVVNSGSSIAGICTNGIDICTGLPVVAPGGGNYSLLLGDKNLGYLDKIKQTYAVTPSNNLFTYRFLAVLEDNNTHAAYGAPYFGARFRDASNNIIACMSYDARSAATGNNYPTNCAGVINIGWTTKVVDLSAYIGQNITVEFIASDCNQGGHFGYAYVDGGCGMMQVNASSTSICQSIGTTTLSAPDGFTSYAWSGPGIVGGSNTQNVAVNMPGTYWVTLSGFCGTSQLTQNVVAGSSPVQISGSNTICTGLNGVLTASGASTYTWSASAGGATTNTVSVSPLTPTVYSVTAIDTNGCTSVSSVLIDNCVWPGDADENLVVNSADLLPIGIKFGQTGPARLAQGNVWQGDPCLSWNDTLADGTNMKYTDCDGSGQIGYNDTLAINMNYNNTHLARQISSGTVQTVSPDIYLLFDKLQYMPGDTVKAGVYIGKSTSPQSNFYGAAFNINYDETKVQPGTEEFYFTNSWVGMINHDQIKFSNLDAIHGLVDASLVRTCHTDTNGYGKIATLQFVLKTSLPNDTLVITISNAEMTNSMGTLSLLNSGADSVAIINGTTGMLNETNHVSLYPNPVNESLWVSGLSEFSELTLIDQLGRAVWKSGAKGEIKVRVADLPNGFYLLEIKNDKLTTSLRVVVHH